MSPARRWCVSILTRFLQTREWVPFVGCYVFTGFRTLRRGRYWGARNSSATAPKDPLCAGSFGAVADEFFVYGGSGDFEPLR